MSQTRYRLYPSIFNGCRTTSSGITPTHGHGAGIVNELPSSQQLSAGGAGSNTSSGGRRRPSSCRGRDGGRPRQRAVFTPVSVVQGLGVTGRGTSGGSNLMNTSNSNRRSLRRSNHQTTPGQISKSTRARILANPCKRSHFTGLCQIAQFQVVYRFRGSAFDAVEFPPRQ